MLVEFSWRDHNLDSFFPEISSQELQILNLNESLFELH